MLIEIFIQQVKYFIQQDPQLAALYLILAKIFGAVLLFPGAPLTLLSGATFGLFWGTIISIIGNTLGASAAFFISRFFLKEYVIENLYSKYPTIQKYEARLFSKGIITILILRLIPLFPFNVLNYLLGVTQVTARDYLVGTAIGMIPGTIAYVYFGKALITLSPLHILISIFVIIILTYIGKFYEKKY